MRLVIVIRLDDVETRMRPEGAGDAYGPSPVHNGAPVLGVGR